MRNLLLNSVTVSSINYAANQAGVRGEGRQMKSRNTNPSKQMLEECEQCKFQTLRTSQISQD